ncbi:MAG: hypothetical protein ACREXW_11230 [Gammaproteobacteria bacterium]
MYLLLIIIVAVLVGWPVAILLAILGWVDTGGMLLWPVAIVVGILWYRNRRPGRSARGPRRSDATWSGELGATRALSLSDTIDLAILRLDLDRQHAAGTLPAERYAELCAGIDGLWMEQLRAVEAGPGSEGWCARRARAFYLLSARGLIAGGPPWVEAGRARPKTEPSVVASDGPPVLSAGVAGEPPMAATGAPIVVPGPAVGTAALMGEPDARKFLASMGTDDRIPAPAAGPMGHDPFSLPTAGGEETGVRIDAATSHVRRTPDGDPAVDRQIAESHAFRPTEPGLLERTLKAVSGWHALIAPFLAQNIGWFMGGFCFVAGSVFLVSYTTGFGKALTIWGALLLYTLLLIGGGYGLRRRRPELRVSSEVLMALGALLVPLTIAAATRLIASSPSFGFVVGGLMAAALSLGLLYPAMLLASGVMDRRLAAHPRLFLALSATQLAVPLLDVWRSWAGIALMHLVILGLLGNALLRFTDEWLQAIFVERRKSAIYAAGTLFYAALVAFVHAIWGAPEDVPLPQGYSGPFLMAASGLLFYVDARLKHWSIGHSLLSQFTFAIYGLSVLALALASGAPVARGMTLVLAIGLYGFVVWRHLTLTPLYLLLGCVSWLYALLVLRPFEPALHLLLALPGLAGLYALNRSVLVRRSARLGEIASWTLGCALFSLTAWSLWNGEPGLVGLATGGAGTGLWYGLNATRTGAGTRQGGVAEKLGSYGVMVLCAVTLAYAPRWPALAWTTQFSLGLAVLAVLWTERGLAVLDARDVTRAAALLDGGLLATALAAALGAWPWQGEPAAALPTIVLVISGLLFFRQGLALYLRPLIYVALGCFTAAGVLTKLEYFPEPSDGGLLMALATLSWVALLALERAAMVRRDPPGMEAIAPGPVTLLWRVEVLPGSRGLRCERLLSAPLTQAMVVLWLAGIGHLLARLAEGRLGWAWVLSAGLGAMVGVLFAGCFRRAGLVTVSLLLGVGAWLAALHRLGFATTEATMLGALTAYAMIAWAGVMWVLRQGVALRLAGALGLSGGYRSEGGRVIIERTAHVAAMGLCLAGAGLAIGGLFDARVALGLDILPVPAIAAGFWCASAWRYRKPMHVYLMLASLSFAGLILYGAASSTTGLGPLAADPGAGLALVLLALGFLVAAWVVERGRDPTGLARMLYPTPLSHTSLGLTLIAVALQAYGMALGHWIEGTTPSVVLAIGGGVLLWANQRVLSVQMDLAAILLLVLALVRAELAVFHDGLAGTALMHPGLADLWVTLAIVSLLLSLGADAVHRWPRGAGRLSEPLRIAAGLCYGSALVAGLAPAMLGPWYGGTGLAGLMLALAVALPPLRWPIPVALLAPVWGLGVALFLSAALGSGLVTHGLAAWTSLCWAYALWALAAFVVPRFNARWPRFALGAGTWPWLGLGFIAVGLVDVGAGPGALALRLLVASGYLSLLLGQSAWPGWAWGAVSGLAAAGGLSMLALLDASMPTASAVELVQWLLIGVLVWANVLLYAGRSWRRYGSGIAFRMGWGGHDLAAPLTAAASLGLGLGFLALGACAWDALLLSFPGVRIGQAGFVILLSLTLALSMGHALALSRTPVTMHGLVAALAGVFLGGYLMLVSSIVHPPLAVAGFALLVYAARSFAPPTDPFGRSVSLRWCTLATLMAIATLVLYWNVPVPERLLTLAVVIGLAAGLGVATGRHAWRMAALGLMIVFLHAWPLAFVPVDAAPLLLPWYALELAVLAGVLERLGWADLGRSPLLDLTARSWSWLCGVAVIEWSLHLLALTAGLAAGSPLARLAGTWDGVAASIAAASILWIGFRRARLARQSPWVYAVCLWAGALGSYLRLMLLELGPVTLWDTAALIVVAYGLVFLQRFFDSRPFLHLAYLMPLAVLMTVPLQLASVSASLGLVTAGSVYLLMRRTTRTATPFYLGVLALNAALYLWIPCVAREAGLIQVYLIPASLSVLILLHLHRREIKPSVAHSTRLGAVTLLYASATADVFLAPGLGAFALALGLSLVGAAFGIALRIRALLYAGVTFLIVNVLGQLVRFYPDGRLAKAVMLMALGAAITAAMVWFNLKRETVLRQVRVFRADLAGWD